MPARARRPRPGGPDRRGALPGVLGLRALRRRRGRAQDPGRAPQGGAGAGAGQGLRGGHRAGKLRGNGTLHLHSMLRGMSV